MLKIDQGTSIKITPVTVHSLYKNYGGMLLGYIFEIVKDRKVADECLVKIFSDLALQLHTIKWDNGSHWLKLQRFAREQLSSYGEHFPQKQSPIPTSVVRDVDGGSLERLTDQQRTVFYNIYYNNSKIDELSILLNKQKDSIRKTLKEAFAIMTNDSEN